jgi:protocatechuate 3,4-dioxygenase beta subunit
VDRDDRPVGRVLTRREALAWLGVSGVTLLGGLRPALAGAAEPPRRTCIARPEQTEGPYFVDTRLHRSDIRSDPGSGAVKAGVPLDVTFRVSRLGDAGCAPIAGAHVDLWHCDAMGVYSDVQDPGFDTTGQQFLRGYQLTDAAGEAAFSTIYPGWYAGRTVHLHFKIRTDPAASRGDEFTSQLYFEDALNDRVHALEPYARKGARKSRNDRDGIFRRGGRELLLAPARKGPGYAATFDVALRPA